MTDTAAARIAYYQRILAQTTDELISVSVERDQALAQLAAQTEAAES